MEAKVVKQVERGLVEQGNDEELGKSASALRGEDD
jgi:hypothetical protein